jgi:hypothetical protein
MIQDQDKQQKRVEVIRIPDACAKCMQDECLQEGCEHIDAYKKYLQNVSEKL